MGNVASRAKVSSMHGHKLILIEYFLNITSVTKQEWHAAEFLTTEYMVGSLKFGWHMPAGYTWFNNAAGFEL